MLKDAPFSITNFRCLKFSFFTCLSSAFQICPGPHVVRKLSATCMHYSRWNLHIIVRFSITWLLLPLLPSNYTLSSVGPGCDATTN